jgi:hypothetical protein
VIRSRSALVIVASPNTPGHSPKVNRAGFAGG